jgi:hypothetical protein
MLRFAPLATLALLSAAPASAEMVVVDGQVSVKPTDIPLPSRGMTMSAVEAKFGAPVAKRDAVGSPQITRWEYAGFIVVFEGDRVLHAVATGS